MISPLRSMSNPLMVNLTSRGGVLVSFLVGFLERENNTSLGGVFPGGLLFSGSACFLA